MDERGGNLAWCQQGCSMGRAARKCAPKSLPLVPQLSPTPPCPSECPHLPYSRDVEACGDVAVHHLVHVAHIELVAIGKQVKQDVHLRMVGRQRQVGRSGERQAGSPAKPGPVQQRWRKAGQRAIRLSFCRSIAWQRSQADKRGTTILSRPPSLHPPTSLGSSLMFITCSTCSTRQKGQTHVSAALHLHQQPREVRRQIRGPRGGTAW